LERLAVKASITYPIIIQEQLWGLLLIHHSHSQDWQKSQLVMLELLAERLTLLITTQQLADSQNALLHRENTLKKIRNLLQSEQANLPMKEILDTVVHQIGGCGGRIYLKNLSGKVEVYQIGEQPFAGQDEILEQTPQWERDLLDAERVYFPDFDYKATADEIKSHSSLPYSVLVMPLSFPQYQEGYLTLFRRNRQEEIWWAGRPPKNQLEMRQVRPSFHPWREVRNLSAALNWTKEEMKWGCAIAQQLADAFRSKELNLFKPENYDSITQLPNRTAFTERLKVPLSQAATSEELFAVVFLDLDRFQQVNNTLGHAAGDQLLKLVAERLQQDLAAQNHNFFLAHWHGDKFVILIEDLTDLDSGELKEKISAIGHSFAEPFSLLGQEIYMKASWGVAINPYDGKDVDTLLLNAETAMYSAKDQGKNGYQVYSSSLRSPLNPLTLETEIRHSLQNSEFCLYYQPQINLQTGTLTAVEGLIRWQHPERGLLSPKHFIPFAEESDLICEIGDWTLKAACKQLAQWREQGAKNLRVAVNVSGRQFQQADFVEKVQQVLEETNIPGSALELEITETTAAQNVDLTQWILKQLQEMGVSVALDDFGMGYSSLNAIKQFPLNTLKVDRNFVKDIDTSAIDSAIINSVITLAQGLNLRVVAEGVETFQQLSALQSLPVPNPPEDWAQEVQGYFISEPLPASETAAFIFNSACEDRFFFQLKRLSEQNHDRALAAEENVNNSTLQQLFNQTRREQVIAQITQQVHASLDLEEIFQITVEEIRQFLQTDRVLLYRFDEDWNGRVVIESVDENWQALLNQEIDDPCFQVKSAPLYANGRVLAIEDIEQEEMTPCYREMLQSFQVRANLVIPILNHNNLWGLLIAHHCRSTRNWQSTEVSLLQQLATQVGVAIHQAELYQQLEQANEKLEELATKDGLTKLSNRRWFDETLDQQWQRLQREQKPLALILCDIDEFKPYNDHYGHPAGDQCLMEVAQALQSVAYRPDDLVARYGGEEFALILPNTSAENAMTVAERARKAVAEAEIPHAQSSVTSHVTLSLGVSALIPGTNNTRKELIRRADQALYQAKAQGRDRAVSSEQ
jgi:diguanylate cyclase (GGDEF)-like protein